MNFIVIGAGAIGSYVGGRLAASGYAVSFVARPYQAEAFLQDGLTVTDPDGFHGIVKGAALKLYSDIATAWTESSSTIKDTVLLLCVKGGATLPVAEDIAKVCPEGVTIISLQNGVENVARIKEGFPDSVAVAGMVPYNVIMKTKAHVHRTIPGFIFIGTGSLSETISACFNHVGLKTKVSPNMLSVQWGKLLLNLNNPINALANLPLRDEFLNHDYRIIWATLQLEALKAMRSADIEPMQLTAVSPRVFPYLLKSPNWVFTRLAARLLKSIDPHARSSMWDDIQQGRKTEVDDLCGAVVRLSKKHGTAAPCNAAMRSLMVAHTKDQAYTGKSLRKALNL